MLEFCKDGKASQPELSSRLEYDNALSSLQRRINEKNTANAQLVGDCNATMRQIDLEKLVGCM